MKIKIKYHDPKMPKLEFIQGKKSDWIDLRTIEDINMSPGNFQLINLGVSMKLPEGFEAHLLPRSSTFKKYGLLMANSIGIVDESYCGEDDIWKMAALATTDVKIPKYTRLCQFRIVKKMKKIELEEVLLMEDESRGGFGSTGEQ